MLLSFKGMKPTIHPSVYIAPGAKLIGDVTAAEDVTIWFNAVLRSDGEPIKIGRGSNIQDGTVIHVDPGFPVTIGEYVTVGHNAIVHGCTIEDGALIGMGATVLNGAVIGKGALVAAGAMVKEGTVVAPGTMVAGVPAKPIKTLDNEAIEQMKRGAQNYIEKGKIYKSTTEN